MVWTSEQIDYLQNNYSRDNKKALQQYCKRSWKGIKIKAYSLGLDTPNLNYSNWSEKELLFLNNNYEILDKNELLNELLPKTWVAINQKAYVLGLKRKNKNSDLSVLLNEDPITYYWIGFLMADGHFSEKGLIQVNLSICDIDHLNKLGKFISLTNKLNKAILTAMDKDIVKKIKEKISNSS